MAAFALPRDPVALEVPQVRRCRSQSYPLEHHQARLDHDPPSCPSQSLASDASSDATAPVTRPSTSLAGFRAETAVRPGFGDGPHNLGSKALNRRMPSRFRPSDLRPEAIIVAAAHGLQPVRLRRTR